MLIEDRTYYEDEQKMEANWILIFIIISGVSSVCIASAFMFNSKADWLEISIVAAAIIFTDALVIFILKSMKLELALVKKGLYFKMSPAAKKGFI
jgi:hypothetical protein